MRLIVNETTHDVAGDPSRALLYVLRDELLLTGTKPACGEGVCGACTVLVDGAPTRACVTAVGDVAGRPITTVEGLAQGALSLVQRALLAERAFQCGYCTPGMVLAITALIEQDRHPRRSAVNAALDRNVCRCGVYPRIVRAVEQIRSSTVAQAVGQEPPAVSAGAQPLLAPRGIPWDRQPIGERDYFEVLGDGLVVVLPPPTEGSGWEESWSTRGGIWLHVGGDGMVTGFAGKVEMGQNNRTVFTSIVSTAMAVHDGAVRMVMADTDLCPYDEGTFGSRSVADAGAMLEAAAWTAIEVLARLAADRLEANPNDLVARNGAIESRDGARRIRYADLLHGVRRLESVTGRPHRPRAVADRVAARQPTTDWDLAAVTGRRTFTTDVRLPGMLEGRQLAPPVSGARLASLDLTHLLAEADVTVVHDGDLVAVAGPDVLAADLAIEAIRAEWDVDTTVSSADLIDYLRTHPADDADADDAFEYESGDVDTALDRGPVLRQTYTSAYVTHFALESRVAVATWTDDRVTVWTATQAPFWAREELAEALGLDEDSVRVIVPALGGGFGAKHGAGPGIAAARLSQRTGRPVRVRWRHADEFAWGHVRPAAVIDVAAAASADQWIQAWDVRSLNAGASAIQPPYQIAHQRLRSQPCVSPLPQSSYRALGATANTFAREVMIDELATLVSADPLEFRLRNIDDERLADALRIAAKRASWQAAGRGHRDGRGLGIAGSVEKDARVATCAEVSVDREGRVRVLRVTTAFDCGAVVDADNLTNQIEGATMMALGPALFEAVTVERGRITTPSLATYRVPRFGDLPDIDVVLIDRREIPSAGGGEVPMIAVAPAIANAIYAACGTRLRSMPLIPDGLLPAPLS
jgi:CO/xanthine dehydrogenase Mo-binding subunit/aerobic-type carbon monoxide dehydrogenase small subunit (CoxS/CutS family)